MFSNKWTTREIQTTLRRQLTCFSLVRISISEDILKMFRNYDMNNKNNRRLSQQNSTQYSLRLRDLTNNYINVKLTVKSCVRESLGPMYSLPVNKKVFKCVSYNLLLCTVNPTMRTPVHSHNHGADGTMNVLSLVSVAAAHVLTLL